MGGPGNLQSDLIKLHCKDSSSQPLSTAGTRVTILGRGGFAPLSVDDRHLISSLDKYYRVSISKPLVNYSQEYFSP